MLNLFGVSKRTFKPHVALVGGIMFYVSSSSQEPAASLELCPLISMQYLA